MSVLNDRLAELATCLCAQLAADGLPEPCFCGVVPGEIIAAEYAGDCAKKCGMAWVRLAALYPASGVGVPSLLPGNCTSGLGMEAEVGVLRCISVGDERGNLPSAAEQLAAAQLQADDALAMRKAIACCVDSKDWILGTYAPMGPEGGLVGGLWTVSMWVE